MPAVRRLTRDFPLSLRGFPISFRVFPPNLQGFPFAFSEFPLDLQELPLGLWEFPLYKRDRSHRLGSGSLLSYYAILPVMNRRYDRQLELNEKR